MQIMHFVSWYSCYRTDKCICQLNSYYRIDKYFDCDAVQSTKSNGKVIICWLHQSEHVINNILFYEMRNINAFNGRSNCNLVRQEANSIAKRHINTQKIPTHNFHSNDPWFCIQRKYRTKHNINNRLEWKMSS